MSKAPQSGKIGLRPASGKTYQESRDGGQEQCKVLQQDVTGLTPLGSAVLHGLRDGDSAHVWRLFYAACEALRRFGSTTGSSQLVPLQCPTSLAVAADGSIVLLDAEIRAAGSLAHDSPIRRLFGAWFGEAGVNGFADARQASLLHSRAMLAYFLNLLRQTAQSSTPAARSATVKVATKLEQAPAGVDLDDLESWVRNNTEDWSLPIDEESLPEADDEPPQTDQRVRQRRPQSPAAVALVARPSAAPRRKRSWLLRLSLYLNLVLILALAILWLLWPRGAVGKSLLGDPAATTGDAPLTFSSYCVIFPTQGTISEKVAASLGDLFPGKALEIKRDADEHRRLLTKQLDDSVKSLDKPDQLKRLLVDLSTNHSIRFKGFVAAEPNDSLPAVIERAGVFTVAGASGEQYGSLLQPNSVDKLLTGAGMSGKEEPRALLDSLKKAVEDYASMQDALGIINDRTAYLLKVDPTPEAHEAVRKKLLSRQDKPVFISRPVPELFDAVDPTADTGGGSAAYTLRLDRKCFWRLAGADDRKNVDFTNNASNGRMKWQEIEPEQLISWKPISLTRKSGKVDVVATFDIGVVVGTKVVIFRNQSILLGDKRADVVASGQNYVEKALGLKQLAPDEAISVRQQDQQFTGTLVYSSIAGLVTDANKGDDLDILDLTDFMTVRMREDMFP